MAHRQSALSWQTTDQKGDEMGSDREVRTSTQEARAGRTFRVRGAMLYLNIRNFLTDACGATGIEYALIGSIVSVMILVAVTSLGDELGSLLQTVTDAMVTGPNAGR